jgi:hypothetical protein
VIKENVGGGEFKDDIFDIRTFVNAHNILPAQKKPKPTTTNKKKVCSWGVPQVEEHLLSKHEALNLKPSIAAKKKKKSVISKRMQRNS